MTVAAVILAASPEGALREIDGRPLVRRLAEAAWAGGGVPVVVVAGDPEGAVAAALAGAQVTLAEPAPREAGTVAQMCRGIDVARGLVTETEAAVVWPARMAWVDPETLTSLIEAHGTDPEPVIRSAFEGTPGWPVLVPIEHLEALRALRPDRMPDDLLDDLAAAGVPFRTLEVGDPGTTHDLATEREDLPPYAGPPEPASGHAHEWGSMAAETADDAPLPGPTVAPWEPAPGR
ncbi:MAG TPA: NTP transferase domain-containing protein [Candidatus Limnocylindrales bacterium]|nr:NTP transferase domain-containing protein [Candidatus Limnocylindrales bacterium]